MTLEAASDLGDTPKDAIGALMKRVHEGDEDAALELVNTYSPPVLRAVRRRLDRNRRLRVRLDSGDVLQDVWAAFLARTSHFERFQRASDLMGFLICLAIHIVEDHRRRNMCAKRSILREEHLPEAGSSAEERLPVENRTPSRIAMAREALASLFQGRPLSHQEVLCRRAIAGIAQSLRLHERTVYKILEQASAWPA